MSWELFKALGHEMRLEILGFLYTNPRSFSELVFDLRMNSGTLKWHMFFLLDQNLVSKSGRGMYKLTEFGRYLLEKPISAIKDYKVSEP